MRGRNWIAAWGVLGVAATFVEAIWRLGARARVELTSELTPVQWAVFALATIGLWYGEGYLALQRRFAPAVVSRALEAASRDRLAWAILAPLYAISVIGAAPRVILRSMLGIGAIVVCVLIVRELPAPWRGIIDGGVCVALGWGLVSLLACLAAVPGAHATTRHPAGSRGGS